jgi:GNAT superfamily N-acetyltransferase
VTKLARGIRPASIDDFEELLAIDHRAVANDAERIAAIRSHVSDGFCWVHSAQSPLEGYAVLIPRHFVGRDFLDLLVVAFSARRSGIGTGLLRAVLDLEGTDQVFTSTNRSNTPMRELLSKEGWQLSGQLDGLDPDDPEMFFFTWRT